MKEIDSEEIRKMLEKSGLKATYQRICVVDCLMNKFKNKHPTVEMIYNYLHKNLPVISMTTVYNTVNALRKKDMINALTITGDETRYDPQIENHHHLLCKKCGRVYDIKIKCPLALSNKKTIAGHRINEVCGYFTGICKDCLKEEV
ncbi:MAG: transcriptional repressor [Candidatus Omnitrophica bacterium]|nr:transcriptional repressor [Candidatus Omnitrophota bacterium]